MLTIGHVAHLAGLRPSTLRYYEEQGLLPLALRRGGKRVYDASVFKRLSLIALAKTAGFTLEEIRGLLACRTDRPSRLWKTVTGAKRLEIDQELARLRLMKSVLAKLERCGCSTLANCARRFESGVARYRANHD